MADDERTRGKVERIAFERRETRWIVPGRAGVIDLRYDRTSRNRCLIAEKRAALIASFDIG